MRVIVKAGVVVIAVFLCLAVVRAENTALIKLEERIASEMEAVIDATGQISEADLAEYEKLVRQGIQKHDEGDVDKAIELYEKALEKNPLSGGAYYEIGYSYHSMGDLQKSLEAILRAIVLDPKSEMAYVMKAGILDDMGLPEEAIEAYRRIIEVKPDSFMAILNLGITLFRENDLDQAVSEFERAQEIVPEHPSPFYFLAVIANQKGETYEEERYLKEFVRVGKDDDRLPSVQQRLKELTTTSVTLNISDKDDLLSQAKSVIGTVEGISRSLWRTKKHRETFPDAKGYFPSFEEELDVIQRVIETWKDQKEKDASLSHPTYDFAAAAEESGFLNEYVWYSNRQKLGQSAETWFKNNEPRVNAFVAWAENSEFSEQVKEEVQSGESDQNKSIGIRDLPGMVMEAADQSRFVYVIGDKSNPGDVEKFRKREGNRFKNVLKKDSNNCVSEKDAREALKNMENEIIPIAYRKVARVFYPGDEEWKTVIQVSLNMGRRYMDRVPPLPAAGVIEKKGDRILVKMADPTWLVYFMAKAVWRYEPDFRQHFGGAGDDKPSIDEEEFAVATMIGGYLNSQESEDDKKQPDPYLDSVLEVFEGQALTGFVLMEILHKTYGVSLECLSEEHEKELDNYISTLSELPDLIAPSGSNKKASIGDGPR